MKLTIPALLCLIFTLSGCNLIEDLIKIPITINSELTIPAGTGAGVLVNVFANEQQTNIEEEMTLNDSRKDRIKTVELRKCVLTVTAPSGADFSFLNDIEVYLSDDDLGDLKIASRYDIPDEIGDELTLDVSHADVADYLKKESIRLKTSVTTDEVLLQNIDINIYTRFRVTADIF